MNNLLEASCNRITISYQLGIAKVQFGFISFVFIFLLRNFSIRRFILS